MNILAIETSSSSGSVAISKNGMIVNINYLDIRITHSERLMPQIDYSLKQCKMTLDDIDLIAVSIGPGSFTGLRIGLATAKGLCFGKEIPLVPISSLKIIAYNVYGTSLPILSLIDAKMGEIYGALYDENYNVIIEPQNAKPDNFFSKIDREVCVVGSGFQVFKEKLDINRIIYTEGLINQHIPLASTMIGIIHLENKHYEFDFDSIADLEPEYLRKSQAELVKEEKERKQKELK